MPLDGDSQRRAAFGIADFRGNAGLQQPLDDRRVAISRGRQQGFAGRSDAAFLQFPLGAFLWRFATGQDSRYDEERECSTAMVPSRFHSIGQRSNRCL